MLTTFGLKNLGLARAPCARSVGLGNRRLHGLGPRTLVLWKLREVSRYDLSDQERRVTNELRKEATRLKASRQLKKARQEDWPAAASELTLQLSSSFKPRRHNGVEVAPQFAHSDLTPPGAVLPWFGRAARGGGVAEGAA